MPPKKHPRLKKGVDTQTFKKKATKQAQESKCKGDFEKCADRITVDGMDAFLIPKGTTLYHGTSISFPDKEMVNAPAYFATLESSAGYAFTSAHHDKKRSGGAMGKIITFKVQKPLILINITKRNLNHFIEQFGLEEWVATIMFRYKGEQLYRFSEAAVDETFTKWFCKKMSGKFDGWAHTIPNFHAEVILCNTDKIKRHSVEIRKDDKYNCFFEMKGSKLQKVFKSVVLSRQVRLARGITFLDPNDKRYASEKHYPRQKSDEDFIREASKVIDECSISSDWVYYV